MWESVVFFLTFASISFLFMSIIKLPTCNFLVLRGLKAILSRWSDQGFNRDLNLFISYLDAASEKNALLATEKKAARTIWAYYLVRLFFRSWTISFSFDMQSNFVCLKKFFCKKFFFKWFRL